jgi:hypothetical protein
MDIALVTCATLAQLNPFDIPLLEALRARGLSVQPLVWNDAQVDWSEPLVSIVRSTWDYYLQRPVFLAWAQHVSQIHTLWNPFELLRWNTHKSYLLDLEKRGIPIIPTCWLRQEASINLFHLMQERGWSEVVLKPAVSIDAYETLLVNEGQVAQGQQHLDRMLAEYDMLVQPFLPTIWSSGERSLIWIDGKVTHAVLREPMLGHDPSKQDQAARISEKLIQPDASELELASTIMDRLDTLALYARIDLVHDVDGQLRVMEVELVEPGLWLAWVPEAVERFADAIVREVEQARKRCLHGQ